MKKIRDVREMKLGGIPTGECRALKNCIPLLISGDVWAFPLEACLQSRAMPYLSLIQITLTPVFQTTSIVNDSGEKDYPCFRTSTTHLDGPNPGETAAYVAFGRAVGKTNGRIMDVHGAGTRRSDPKIVGTPMFRGLQGNAVRSGNFVRCVRGGNAILRTHKPVEDKTRYPYKGTFNKVV